MIMLVRAKTLSLLCLLVVLAAFSCKKKPNNEPEDTFQKSTIMENVANNIILVEYQNLDTRLNAFQQSYATFIADQSQPNFDALRNSWKEAYIQWEKSLMFEFGPAMDQLLKGTVGTFPTDTTKILNNISAGSYNLDEVANITAQGLPAFDFLLYRPDAITYFSASNYQQYGTDLITKMRGHVTSVISAWNSGYLNTFKSSTGTETTSAFSQFVNQFVKSYEELKWTKVGIPIGKQTMAVQQPHYIETRRAEISFPLMIENMKALHRLFNGNAANGSQGVGFDDYLIALERQELVDHINATFESIISDMEAFSDDLETEMANNPAALDALYTKIHGLTVSLKTDMTSAFAVLITYQDNDGD